MGYNLIKAIKVGNLKIVYQIITNDKNSLKETSGTIILGEAVKEDNLEI